MGSRKSRGGVVAGLSLRGETNTGRGAPPAAALDFTCLPSPGKGHKEAARGIIFRAIFKQCG